jgi:hypothetical protein
VKGEKKKKKKKKRANLKAVVFLGSDEGPQKSQGHDEGNECSESRYTMLPRGTCLSFERMMMDGMGWMDWIQWTGLWDIGIV